MNLEGQTGVESVLYRYDGAGQRVESCQTNTAGVCDPAGSQTVFTYDVFGNLAAEYDSGAAVLPICTACYISTDQVGSTRLITNPGGGIVSRHDYLPFGYDMANNFGRNVPNAGWGQTDYVKELFTGQLEDTETQFNWFRTRYYTHIQGRFHSPDPFNAGADLTNPQSWNGYAYVNDNPMSNNDPWGLQSSGVTDYWGTQTPPVNPTTSGSSFSGVGFGWSWGDGATGSAALRSTFPVIDSQFSFQMPAKSQTCAAITPPSGPINYAANAQRNAPMGLIGLYQAFKGGGTQDFKGNSAFGTRANQAASGNFNFGASIAAKGWSLFTAQALAGAGALLSNLNSQGGYALAQSVYMQGQYGGPSGTNPGSGAPAWNMGPGFPGFPVLASNGIPTQGDQVAPYENAAVVAGYTWYSLGCYQ